MLCFQTPRQKVMKWLVRADKFRCVPVTTDMQRSPTPPSSFLGGWAT